MKNNKFTSEQYNFLGKIFSSIILKYWYWILLQTITVIITIIILAPGSFFAFHIMINEWAEHGWTLRYVLSGIYILNSILIYWLIKHGQTYN